MGAGVTHSAAAACAREWTPDANSVKESDPSDIGCVCWGGGGGGVVRDKNASEGEIT
jgi:hypothetical protein